MWRARVYIYVHNISLLTSVKEVTRFIAMLDFYCLYCFRCDITAMYFYEENPWDIFALFCSREYRARYDIFAALQTDGSFSASFVFKTRYDEFIFNAVKCLLKLYADQPICYYLSVRAISSALHKRFSNVFLPYRFDRCRVASFMAKSLK